MSYLRYIFKNYSYFRVLYNFKLISLNLKLKGSIIDLAGGKFKNTDYSKSLNLSSKQIKTCDLNLSDNIDFVLDLEEKLKFKSFSWDNVLLFNSLMFIYNYNQLVSEVYRILKKGGYFIGTTNYTYWISKEPNDYFRFTGDALERMFNEAGFKNVKIYPLGGRFTSSFYLIESFFYFKIIKYFMLKIGLLFDKIASLLIKNHPAPIGYLFVCKK